MSQPEPMPSDDTAVPAAPPQEVLSQPAEKPMEAPAQPALAAETSDRAAPVDASLVKVAEKLRPMFEAADVPQPDETALTAETLRLKQPIDDLAKDIAALLTSPKWGMFLSDKDIVTIEDGVMEPMTAKSFRTWLPEVRKVIPVIRWKDGEKEDSEGRLIKVPVKGELKKDQAETVLASLVLRKALPVLNGINGVRLPMLQFQGEDERGMPTGPLRLLQEGYDATTGVLTVPGGLNYPEDLDFDEAVDYFFQLFRHFGWRCHERDFAIHLAAILTMFGRGIYMGKAPMFWWNANMQESGKTTLASYVTWLVHGTRQGRPLLPDAEEKLMDTLDTAALQKRPYVFFDNVNWKNKPVETVLLDEWLTNEEHAFRRKGVNVDVDVKLRAMTLGTGNGVTLSTDLQRRSLMADLVNKEAGADRHLAKGVTVLDSAFFANAENRRRGLAAAWALVRDWDQEGRPMRPGKWLGSFEGWARVVPSIVWHAGKKGGGKVWDCMAVSTNEDIGDKESLEFKRLAELAVAEFGPGPDGVMREAFEILVMQFAGVARRNVVATRSLWPEQDIESVMQTEGKKGGWTFAAGTADPSSNYAVEGGPQEVEDIGEWQDGAGRGHGDVKSRERSASEWLSPTSRSAFGNALKKKLHERYFGGPDGKRYELLHRSGVTPARYTVTRVK